MTLLELFEKGGWAMKPLMVFSVVTLGLVIERLLYIIFHNLSLKDITWKVILKVQSGDMQGALDYCLGFKQNKLGAQVIGAGIKVAHLGEHRMEKALEASAAEKINSLERGFNFLVALGSIAPITGFLGTVSGMISAFQSIATASNVNAQLVAGGIFEALITTAFGLAIAIVAITAYNILAHFVDKFTADIEEAGSSLVTAVLLKESE